VGHGAAGQAKELGQFDGAQLGPRSERFETAMTSELGEQSERQERRQGVALATSTASIWHHLQVSGKRLETEGKGQVGGQLEWTRRCGRVHGTPPLRTIGG
jgi:hypothetical protein